MQEAIAGGLGVDKGKVQIDYDAKQVSVDLGGAELDLEKVAAAFEGTSFGLAE